MHSDFTFLWYIVLRLLFSGHSVVAVAVVAAAVVVLYWLTAVYSTLCLRWSFSYKRSFLMSRPTSSWPLNEYVVFVSTSNCNVGGPLTLHSAHVLFSVCIVPTWSLCTARHLISWFLGKLLKIVAIKCHVLKLKSTKSVFVSGSARTHSPESLSGFKGSGGAGEEGGMECLPHLTNVYCFKQQAEMY